MTSAIKKIVVVMGATGAQGGSVVRSLLEDGSFDIRAVTRNPASEPAQELAKKGVEVVKADANHKDQLAAAFKGAYAVFAVTNFWDKEVLMGDHGLEEKQGKLIADVAEEAKVQHFIWSTLPNTSKISGGKYNKVVHFDGKARVEEYIRKKDLPATFVEAGFYLSNLQTLFVPTINADGAVEFAWPMKPEGVVGWVDIPSDFGPVVLGVLKAGPQATKNINVRVAGENLSAKQFVDIFAKVTGRKAVYVEVSPEDYKKKTEPVMGPVLTGEMLDMFLYFGDYGYFGGAHVAETKKFNPKMTTVEQWLKTTGWTGPAQS